MIENKITQYRYVGKTFMNTGSHKINRVTYAPKVVNLRYRRVDLENVIYDGENVTYDGEQVVYG